MPGRLKLLITLITTVGATLLFLSAAPVTQPTFAFCQTDADCSFTCGPGQGSQCPICNEACTNNVCGHSCAGGCSWSCNDSISDPCACGGGGDDCQCTPQCIAPSGLVWTTPAGTPLTGQNLAWSMGNWGLDSNQSQCSDNQCAFQSPSGNGVYKLYEIVGGSEVNRTSWCTNSSGGVINQITPFCILSQEALGQLQGRTVTFRVRGTAQNSCGSVHADQTYTFASNEKPYCEGITVTGGRMAKGMLGAKLTEPLTFHIKGGESDPYGPPSGMEVCYALRNQPNSFYTDGMGGWKCFPVQDNTDTFSINTTLQNLIDDYNPTKPTTPANLAQAIRQHGFVMMTNVYDNGSAGYCSANPGHNNGGGIFINPPNPNSGCDAGSCALHIFNHQPNIESVSPTGTTYVGTASDDDNGFQCVDNNPMRYSMVISDGDGSSDIDHVQVNLASPAVTLNPDPTTQGMRRWELKATFVKQQYGLANMFSIRDINTDNPAFCHRGDLSMEPWGINNQFCMMISDSHNFSAGILLSNQTFQGVPVNVYYLGSAHEVYTGGHRAVLKPAPNATAWQDGTFVAYEINGDRVFASFVVEFKDDAANTWNGEYNQVWFTRDILTYDSIARGEDESGTHLLHIDGRKTYHQIGKTVIDLEPPVLNLSEPEVISASEWKVNWSASDPDSGLKNVFGEAEYQPTQSGESGKVITDTTAVGAGDPNVATDYNPNNHTEPGNPFLWNLTNINAPTASRSEIIDVRDNDRGTFTFNAYAQDLACNATDLNISDKIDLPWLVTRGGLVYSAGTPEVAVTQYEGTGSITNELSSGVFKFMKEDADLSTEWLATGFFPATLPKMGATGAYSNLYYDNKNNNANPDWIHVLRESLERKMLKESEKYNVVDGDASLSGSISTLCNDEDKMCVINRSANLTIPSNLTCNRKTAIFVGGDLTINGDIKLPSNDRTNGCIFLVSGNVIIMGGSHKSSSMPPKYDTIDAFILTYGYVDMPEVDQAADIRDGLRVRGSLLAFGADSNNRSFNLGRSLKLIDNVEYPTQALQHDKRYIFIARELFGGEQDTYKHEIGFKN